MSSSNYVETHINYAENKFLSGDIEEAIQSAHLAKLCSSNDPSNSVLADRTLAAYNVHKAALTARANGTNIDWHAVLGITDRRADTETIKKSYKKLALMVHPDKNHSKAAEGAFKLVGQAWNVLSANSNSNSHSSSSSRDSRRKSCYKHKGTRSRCNERKGCKFCGDPHEYENNVCTDCWSKIFDVQEQFNSSRVIIDDHMVIHR